MRKLIMIATLISLISCKKEETPANNPMEAASAASTWACNKKYTMVYANVSTDYDYTEYFYGDQEYIDILKTTSTLKQPQNTNLIVYKNYSCNCVKQ